MLAASRLHAGKNSGWTAWLKDACSAIRNHVSRPVERQGIQARLFDIGNQRGQGVVVIHG